MLWETNCTLLSSSSDFHDIGANFSFRLLVIINSSFDN